MPGGRLAKPSPATTAAGFVLGPLSAGKLVTSDYSLMSSMGLIHKAGTSSRTRLGLLSHKGTDRSHHRRLPPGRRLSVARPCEDLYRLGRPTSCPAARVGASTRSITARRPATVPTSCAARRPANTFLAVGVHVAKRRRQRPRLQRWLNNVRPARGRPRDGRGVGGVHALPLLQVRGAKLGRRECRPGRGILRSMSRPTIRTEQ